MSWKETRQISPNSSSHVLDTITHDEKDSKGFLISLKAFGQLPAAARVRIAVNAELKVEFVFALHPFVPCRRRIEPYINPTRRS